MSGGAVCSAGVKSLGAMAAAALLLAGCGGDSGAAKRTEAGGASAGTATGCPFEDVTERSGIHFRHHTGASGGKLLPETIGAGAAFLDYDGDGHLDVFLVDSGPWPDAPDEEDPPRCALYRGRGDGSFVDVSSATGAAVAVYGMGCAVADYDADGDADVYVTALGRNLLLRNDGGMFTDVAESAGVGGGTWTDSHGRPHPDWSTAALWFDADGDRDVDLLVANYCQWTRDLEVFTTLDGTTKAFTTPDRYTGLPCRLYLGRGDGTFEDATESAGLAPHLGKALGAATWDFDGDGLPEVVVANDTRPNFYFANLGGGRFAERGIEARVAYDEHGRARAGMGVDVADYANDGVAGIAIGNFAKEPASLYRRQPDGTFRPAARRARIVAPTLAPLTFGLAFADLDLDGAQDLVLVNGHIEPDIERFFPGESHAQPIVLLRGDGRGGFDDASAASGPDLARPRVGRGLALGDVDEDGDLDMLVTTNGGDAVLLANRIVERTGRRSLRVRLRGRPPATDALGAVVTVTADGVTQTRVRRTGSSYLSQSEPTLTFGLPAENATLEVRVRWPDGETSTVPVARNAGTVTIDRE